MTTTTNNLKDSGGSRQTTAGKISDLFTVVCYGISSTEVGGRIY